MDPETSDRITKQFLKQLPIWDCVSNLNAQAEELNFHVVNHTEKLKDLCNRADRLPTISQEIKSDPPVTLEKDIIKICKRNPATGDYDITTQIENKPPDPKVQEDGRFYSSISQLQERPKEGEEVYAMYKLGEPWIKCKIKHVQHKKLDNMRTTTFRLHMLEPPHKTLDVNKYSVARIQNHGSNLRATKRVIADLMPGIIGQDPCDKNKHRYLVLMDDGSARYFEPSRVYPIIYQSTCPWDDARCLGGGNSNLKTDLTYFFRMYPQRRIIKVSVNDEIHIYRDGMTVPALVMQIDKDTMKVIYKDKRQEWLYRGSARVSCQWNFLGNLLANNLQYEKLYFKLPGYIQLYQQAGESALGGDLRFVEDFKKLIICGKAPSARKSTARPTLDVNLRAKPVSDDRQSKPDLQELLNQFSDHKKCDPGCLNIPGIRTEQSVYDIIAEFRHVSDLKVPLMLGWRRLLVSSAMRGQRPKLVYIYQAPCDRIIHQAQQIRKYIQTTNSQLDVDYFTFDRDVDLNRTVNEYTAFYFKENMAKDSKTMRPLENKFISVMNHVNEEELPRDFEYHNESFPHPMLRAKGFSFNLDFKSGCDCEDDCQTRPSCACHQLTEQAFGTNAHHKGSVDLKCQYKWKRLLAPVSTGIFECNSYCGCSSKCLNRVVQNGIRFRLQVRRTLRRGFGVFTLDDIPAGAFIATYAAELLDDADQYGDCDMYFADLDYISAVEEQKNAMSDDEKSDEGVDVDEDSNGNSCPRKKKKVIVESSSSDSEYSVEEFMPRAITERTTTRYPKRRRAVSPQAGRVAAANNQRPRFRSLHEILGETSDYTLDARMQGNIGRFFNHSCDPNAFVQNVFIESHDLRFPIVAFFAKRPIEADDEITWNYNYKMGSIEGRYLECTCGAPNCGGRIL